MAAQGQVTSNREVWIALTAAGADAPALDSSDWKKFGGASRDGIITVNMQFAQSASEVPGFAYDMERRQDAMWTGSATVSVEQNAKSASLFHGDMRRKSLHIVDRKNGSGSGKAQRRASFALTSVGDGRSGEWLTYEVQGSLDTESGPNTAAQA